MSTVQAQPSQADKINDAVMINVMTRLAAEDHTLVWLAERAEIEQHELEEDLYGVDGFTLGNVIRVAMALDTTVPALVEGVS